MSTHDPLCPYEPERRTPCTHGLDENGFASIESITTDVCRARHYWPGVPCDCDLIEKVRADQRERDAQRVESCANRFKAQDFNDAVSTCVAAVRGES